MTATFHLRATKEGTFDLLTVPFDSNARRSKESGLTAVLIVDRLFAARSTARVWSIDAEGLAANDLPEIRAEIRSRDPSTDFIAATNCVRCGNTRRMDGAPCPECGET